ncbi:unnamed protein product [Effrenium voratum]|nr:unnamed protein product [Effrenium voratum]
MGIVELSVFFFNHAMSRWAHVEGRHASRSRRTHSWLPGRWLHTKELAVLSCCWGFSTAEALVDCSRSPNCTALRRQPCSERGSIANACGHCLPGTQGGDGPMNTVCLSKTACSAIYPGEDTCNFAASNGVGVPFPVPFGRCVCDDGSGRFWPTAPGKCARVVIKFAAGIGEYEVQQCSRGCDDAATFVCLFDWMRLAEATCAPLALWPPNISQSHYNDVLFQCKLAGEDSVQLLDNCDDVTSQLTPSSFCGHTGFTATSSIYDALGDLPVDCELAPRCPASVLETTRLEQSCCFGTPWSMKLDSLGQELDQSASGFCQMVMQADLNESNSSVTSSFDCLVKTSAPGWSGCACLDSSGFLQAGRTCTVKCEQPDCNLPEDGIRPVPTGWLSSEVDPSLLVDHGKLVSSAANHRHLWPLLLLILTAERLARVA